MVMTKHDDDYDTAEERHATSDMGSILRNSVQHVIRNRNTLKLTT